MVRLCNGAVVQRRWSASLGGLWGAGGALGGGVRMKRASRSCYSNFERSQRESACTAGCTSLEKLQLYNRLLTAGRHLPSTKGFTNLIPMKGASSPSRHSPSTNAARSMSQYQRAPGKPPCPKGCECYYKKVEHWQSFDHPPEHPKVVRRAKEAAKEAGRAQAASGVHRNRSNCALQARDGDDPKLAKYTCSGCGESVIGYGRWRNHMKRARVSQGQRAKTPQRSNDAAAAAAAVAAVPSLGFTPAHPKEVTRAPSESDESVDELEPAAKVVAATVTAPKVGNAPAPPAETKKTGTRWLGEAGPSGKRQRKFF